jgi:spore germination protein GerM
VKRLPIVILASFVAAFGAASGDAVENGSRDSATEQGVITQPPTGSIQTTVYFLTDDGAAPIGVRRTIETKSPYAREALNALLAGPMPEETSLGITTAIPNGTRLLTMTYKRQGADETVNLTGLPPQEALDVMQKTRIITQIARTLIGVSGIEQIWVEVDGHPWGLGLMDGGVDTGPWSYDDLTGLDVGAACAGTETVECDHFDALP